MPDDDDPGFGMKTATLRDYQRKHHAEVTALSQVVEAIRDMQAIRENGAKVTFLSYCMCAQVRGWVELFVPHYPCSSCTGALVQFAARHPQISVRVGHDDWRHWLRSQHRICNALYEHWLGDRTEAWVLSGIHETTSPSPEPDQEPTVVWSCSEPSLGSQQKQKQPGCNNNSRRTETCLAWRAQV
ncbi:ppdK [Symbiodinium necroappetens]|uniref:PpdK protein n=1 Tax=Symbiodinium necroappetens TaxID=1628268 RepID=A0A812ZER0_9DINO|nr:ppdK [Symbiodinium necroappetens]